MAVIDDVVGFPADFDPVKNIGVRVIATLVGRLKASRTFESKGRGTMFGIAPG